MMEPSLVSEILVGLLVVSVTAILCLYSNRLGAYVCYLFTGAVPEGFGDDVVKFQIKKFEEENYMFEDDDFNV